LWREGELTPFCDAPDARYPAVSDDGRMVALTFPHSLRLWTFDGARWSEFWSRPTPFAASSTALSKDHRHVVIGTHESTAYLWDLRTRDEDPVELPGLRAMIASVAFSLDGTQLATASRDGTIRVWDVESATTTVQLRHRGVHTLAFTSSGQLVSAGSDGTVCWWWLTAEPLKKAVAELDVDALTDEERERVGHLRAH